LKGIVIDEQNNNPVANASVFLNTTSFGTVTNSQGHFELAIPNGRYDLIVSSIGYTTYSQTVYTDKIQDFVTIRLKLKTLVMETVIIEPYEKDGWEKWGNFFLERFIGTSAYAQNCKIENIGVIHFRNSKKNNELTAVADEPLIIINKALGYTIQYQLENFTYNFKSHYLIYAGYPFFQLMKGNSHQQKRWNENRSEAYFGSMMHFMRSDYRNKIIEENFEVRSLQKIPNYEKQRVKAAFTSNQHKVVRSDGTLIVDPINKDTANYYDRILSQQDYKDIIGKNLLTGDSTAYAVDSTTAGLDFKNYLLIIYKNKPAPPEYRHQFPKSSTAMMSEIILINQRPVEIHANGSYYNPVDVMSTGYWAWSETIAMMLPFDYVPPKH